MPAGVRDVLRDALGRADRELDALRRSDPRGWHLTLAFVGVLADERVPALHAAVADAVAGAGATPIELALDGAGRFGDRVLFAAVADRPDGVLVRFGATLQTALDRAGLPVERRTVRPHITVARGGRTAGVTVQTVEALQAALGVGPLRWIPESVAVYRAVDRDGPAHYAVETSVPLPVRSSEG